VAPLRKFAMGLLFVAGCYFDCLFLENEHGVHAGVWIVA